MGEIFDRAWRVVVHLGNATEGSRMLFRGFAEADATNRYTSLDDLAEEEAILQELALLYQRPWWKRIWVLQEVHLKRSIVFMCGRDAASYKALHERVTGYSGSPVSGQLEPLALYTVGGLRTLSYIRTLANEPDCAYDLRDYDTTQMDLWDLLLDSSNHLATGPRDKVIALRSLIMDRQEDLDRLVDYTPNV